MSGTNGDIQGETHYQRMPGLPRSKRGKQASMPLKVTAVVGIIGLVVSTAVAAVNWGESTGSATATSEANTARLNRVEEKVDRLDERQRDMQADLAEIKAAVTDD